ncbi:5507_t:CDS:2 [Diversispora eburnea]|uniref:5507_t:CDS:1 n=1 Tax=Diversispora eburnea TaxID=1213867 RepID=A0A9N9C4M5_9GLOM|nr:5507_t:CDS:2 [Diversispora eburnea]
MSDLSSLTDSSAELTRSKLSEIEVSKEASPETEVSAPSETKQSTEPKTHKTLTPEYLEWEAEITVAPGISIDEIRPKLCKRYKEETGLDPWINFDSSQIMTNIQPKINLPELVWQRFEVLWDAFYNLSKKNRKFQEKCILIAQVLLGEKPIIEYLALEVQGAQHRLHSTSWYKDVKKLEDVVNRDRKKRCICQNNGIFLLEIWYDEKPEIVIPERIQKIKGFVNQAFKIFDL